MPLADGPLVEAARADPGRIGELHDAQPWRLTDWRTEGAAITHRRFFSITSLIGMRVEDEAVWDDMHALIVDLAQAGTIDGLRVDHVDGLADPSGYLTRLAERTGLPIWVEKILSGDEAIPEGWGHRGRDGICAGGRHRGGADRRWRRGGDAGRVRGARGAGQAVRRGGRRGARAGAGGRARGRGAAAHGHGDGGGGGRSSRVRMGARADGGRDPGAAQRVPALPDLWRRGRDAAGGRGDDGRAAGDGRGARAAAGVPGPGAALGRAGGHGVPAAVPAGDGRGGGQVPGGHRVLPRRGAALGQRGRGRAGATGAGRRGLPRGHGRAAGGDAPRAHADLLARHQAQRGRARAHPDPDPRAGRVRGLGGRARDRARAAHGVVPGAIRLRIARGGGGGAAPGGPHGQGAARGRAAVLLAGAGRGDRGGGPRGGRGGDGGASRAPSRGGRDGEPGGAVAGGAEADDPRRARRLPGDGGAGLRPDRPRQPAAARLGCLARRAGARRRGGTAARGGGEGRPDGAAAAAAAGGAGGVPRRGLRARGGAGGHARLRPRRRGTCG